MKQYDVAVIGGGPGGSTAAALFARSGRSVLVLEREKFPRFHIGESLIPFGNDILERTGVLPKIREAGFVVKKGAEFTLGNSKGLTRIWFRNNLSPLHAQTWQVERAKFDELLLNHAESCGCEVRQETRVESVEFDETGATLSYANGHAPEQARARWVIDATGRDAFVGRKLGLPKTDLNMPKRFAVFSHFRGVKRNPGEGAGNIIIVRLHDAWFWIIPLDEEKTSVGIVQRLEWFKKQGLEPEAHFWNVVHNSTELSFRMKDAEAVSSFHTTGDYTYRHLSCAGPRYALVGDAAGFIDPIFSSGVMVAMRSASAAFDCIDRADRAGRTLSAADQRAYTRRVKQMTNVFLRLIRTYYDNDSFEVFMNPVPWLGLPRAVNHLVSGNTQHTWNLRLRIAIFYLLCKIQKFFALAPRVNFKEERAKSDATTPIKKVVTPTSSVEADAVKSNATLP